MSVTHQVIPALQQTHTFQTPPFVRGFTALIAPVSISLEDNVVTYIIFMDAVPNAHPKINLKTQI